MTDARHRPKRVYRNMNLEKATQARELYFSRQMTQKQIAAKLGVKQNTVSRIVSGVVWNG